MKRISCPVEWDIMPMTFILPREFTTFVKWFSIIDEKHEGRNMWIMKPVGKSQGKGISVINEIE